MSKADAFADKYILMPLSILLVCGMVLTSAFEDGFDIVDNLLVAFYFLLIISFSYESGFKKYYKRGCVKYFYIVFIAPSLMTAITYFVLWIRT